MTTGITIVFALVLLAAVLFATEILPNEISAIGILVLLVFLGKWTLITPKDAIAGFASPAVVTVLSMFILSEGVRRTGLLKRIGNWISEFTKASETRQLLATIGLSGPLSGFVNNTPIVSVLIPVISDMARKNQTSPSKLMIPLSYASMLGGMLTLIGTTPTILASDFSELLLNHPFSMFEFTHLGIIVLITGGLYLTFIGSRILPERIKPELDLVGKFQMEKHLYRARIPGKSKLAGTPLSNLKQADEFDLDILQIHRGGFTYSGPTDLELQPGDVLIIRAHKDVFDRFCREHVLNKLPDQKFIDRLFIDDKHTLVEATITAGSSLSGETVISANFRPIFGGTVVAIQRGDQVIRGEVEHETLHEGDSLLVLTNREAQLLLPEGHPDLTITRRSPADEEHEEKEKTEEEEERPEKAWISLTILLAVIAVASTNLTPIYIAALGGVFLMVATGCLKIEEGYRAVSWNVVFLLAAILPLGLAMKETGGANYLAGQILDAIGTVHPIFYLFLYYLLTSIFANFVGPSATVMVLIPISITTATQLGAEPFSFVLAVTFGASTAFLTPVGYQTNLMVYTPGGYRFRDYFLVGAPLQLILSIVTTLGIYLFWGV